MQKVYVNRILNMKKIKVIGFDMDYTLVRYHTEKFEELAYYSIIDKLITEKNYPKEIKSSKFDFHQVIQGLVIDKKRGNLLKLSRFGKVKQAFHGLKPIPFHEQQKIYQEKIIDLRNQNIQSLDTNFAISNGVIFSQLTELKSQDIKLPDYTQMADDIKEMVDLAHRDGTLKNAVAENIEKYIIQDAKVVELLERYKSYGKKLLVITNSEFSYTKLLLDYAITPFLKNYKTWDELFDIVVTASQKPIFFTEKSNFLKIDLKTGYMTNVTEKIEKGIFQGGNSTTIQKDLDLDGSEILYLGDHIYGDVVSIKKTCNWRSALVLEPIVQELEGLRKGQHINDEITKMMEEKSNLEEKLNNFYTLEFENQQEIDKAELNSLYRALDELNQNISSKIIEYHQFFNENWGELMRAGHEESRFAGQVEKYACLYMEKVSDLLEYSPRTYFRPEKRILPHERLERDK